MNRATFYGHFRDQYELLDYFISEAFREELGRRLPTRPGLDEETLRVLVVATCDFLSSLEKRCRTRTDRQFIRPMVEEQVQSELYEELLGWIEEASSAQKANGRQASPENTAAVVSWAIFGAGMEWSRRSGEARSAEEFADEVLSVIVEGLQL